MSQSFTSFRKFGFHFTAVILIAFRKQEVAFMTNNQSTEISAFFSIFTALSILGFHSVCMYLNQEDKEEAS